MRLTFLAKAGGLPAESGGRPAKAGGLAAAGLAAVAGLGACAAEPPVVRLEREGLVVETSCTLALAPLPLADTDGTPGVLTIAGDGITVDFQGELRGAELGADPDTYAGTGLRITGRDVTVRGLSVSGYKVGIHGDGAAGLVLEGCDVSDNFRQRLASTRAAEAESDWLWPHANDGGEWRAAYGAGIALTDCDGARVLACRARAVQNGLVLERTDRALVSDCDFSFLSGWGIALWRSSDNLISRNALDFCVRGYSHGVYSRGQDSAGILCFEQSSRNAFVENSMTHGGDGFFGFAGREALGQGAAPDDPDARIRGHIGFDHSRAGSNDNLLYGNDCSYAAAHGIELTFGFGNRFIKNTLCENAISGLWAGYCRDTLVMQNDFRANGPEGGVAIEHGERNTVLENLFAREHVGVSLWWDEDAELAGLPWAAANGTASAENVLVRNTFRDSTLGVLLCASPRTFESQNRYPGTPERVRSAGVAGVAGVADVDGPAGAFVELETFEPAALPKLAPVPAAVGSTRPLGARAQLAGRDMIVMTEWGPYDHETPLVELVEERTGEHEWRLLGARGAGSARLGERSAPELDLEPIGGTSSPRWVVKAAASLGRFPYDLVVEAQGTTLTVSGIVTALE